MNVLNLYAGIGGNRKLWKDVKVVAVEHDPRIAKIYKDFFPDDEMLVEDAHSFLLENFEDFDFIWSSPPCPSHSRIRKNSAVPRGQNKPVYPDLRLYQEILFLQGYFKGKFVVENVIAWYDPLIKPRECGSHWFWANFKIQPLSTKSREHDGKVSTLEKRKGFDLSKYKSLPCEKRLLLRNCVEPEIGLHVLNCAFKQEQKTLPRMVFR